MKFDDPSIEIIYSLITDKMDAHEKRLDKFEDKIDSLIEFKYTWLGRISALAFIASICGAVVLVWIEKKIV